MVFPGAAVAGLLRGAAEAAVSAMVERCVRDARDKLELFKLGRECGASARVRHCECAGKDTHHVPQTCQNYSVSVVFKLRNQVQMCFGKQV
jgi:hypothetical protein